jgi:hypothetical protein
MKTRAALVLAVLGGAASAFGQIQATQVKVSYTLSFQTARVGASGTFRDGAIGEHASGTAGQVDVGLEGALFTIKMAMRVPDNSLANTGVTPQFSPTGTPMTWAPTVLAGSSGSGTLSAFWSGDLNMAGGANGNGGWSDGTTNFAPVLRRRLSTFIDSAAPGSPNGSGNAVTDIQPSQFGANTMNLLHDNDLACWIGLWIPGAAGGNRTASWAVTLGSLGLLSQVAAMDDNAANGANGGSFNLPIALNVATEFGAGVNVPVLVPGPSSLALLGLGGLLAARRRR